MLAHPGRCTAGIGAGGELDKPERCMGENQVNKYQVDVLATGLAVGMSCEGHEVETLELLQSINDRNKRIEVAKDDGLLVDIPIHYVGDQVEVDVVADGSGGLEEQAVEESEHECREVIKGKRSRWRKTHSYR